MFVESGVFDANILVYAVDVGAPQHGSSLRLLESAHSLATALFLTSQILCEVYSIATNPRRIAAPYSPSEALEAIEALLAVPGIHLLATTASAVDGWMELLRRHPVTGGGVFDLHLAGTMLANNVRRIYTFNTKDFKVFPELTVISPSEII